MQDSPQNPRFPGVSGTLTTFAPLPVAASDLEFPDVADASCEAKAESLMSPVVTVATMEVDVL